MAKSKIWHTTGEAAELTGASKTTVWRTCRQYPGFGVRFNRTFKIPDEHVKRILAGERPADIAAKAQAGGALSAA